MKSSVKPAPALSLHSEQNRSLKTQESEAFSHARFFDNNYWIAPDCHLLEMRKQMKVQLNGYGGDFEEPWLYFDSEGAAHWLSLSNSKFYSPIQTLDLNFVADVIYHHWKRNQFQNKHIHIIGLGCGKAEHEIRLVHRMLDRIPDSQISLYLIDMSPFLLNEAQIATQEAFAHKNNITTTLIQGNFENLSTYQPIIKMAQESNDLIVLPMFGFSFCNLKNERLFIRNTFRAFRRHTLFLGDILLAAAPADDYEQVKKQDPLLATESYFQTQEEINFLIGPLRQHRLDMQKVEIYRDLDYSTCADGSYAVEIRALVNEQSQFTVMRMRKYEPIKLANMFLKEGWAPVQAFPYGFEHDPRMLYMLSKT